MTFSAPFYLWLLLLLVPLLLFSLRQIKKDPVSVPHLRFWIEERETSQKIWRLLRWPISFTIFSVLILALADPVIGDLQESQEGSLLLLLDSSASMGTIEENGKTRWQLARDIAAKLEEKIRCTIISLSPPRMVSLSDLPTQVSPTSTGQLAESIEMILQLCQNRDRVVFITDTAGKSWQTPYQRLKDQLQDRLFTYVVGAQTSNAGIAIEQGESLRQLAVVIHSDIDEKRFNLHWRPISALPEYWDSIDITKFTAVKQPFTVNKGESHRYLIDIPPYATWIDFCLQPLDAFPSDNRVVCRLPQQQRAKVLLISKESRPYLVAALGAYQNLVDIEASETTAVVDIERENLYDLAIICHPSWRPNARLARNFLVWGVPPDSLPMVENHVVWRIDNQHPLCRDLDLSLLKIDKAAITPLAGEEVIINGNHGPLMWISKRDQSRYIYTAFSLEDSQFAALPAFPLFIRNVLRWSLDISVIPDSPTIVQTPQRERDIAPQIQARQLPESLQKVQNTTQYRHLLLWIALSMLLVAVRAKIRRGIE